MGSKYQEMVLWYTGKLDIAPSCSRIKSFLIKLKGPECWECGWSGKNIYTNTWVIDLDHIDGSHENTRPSNFRLLCPNCHAMTSTYKYLNTKHAKSLRGASPIIKDDWS